MFLIFCRFHFSWFNIMVLYWPVWTGFIIYNWCLLQVGSGQNHDMILRMSLTQYLKGCVRLEVRLYTYAILTIFYFFYTSSRFTKMSKHRKPLLITHFWLDLINYMQFYNKFRIYGPLQIYYLRCGATVCLQTNIYLTVNKWKFIKRKYSFCVLNIQIYICKKKKEILFSTSIHRWRINKSWFHNIIFEFTWKSWQVLQLHLNECLTNLQEK